MQVELYLFLSIQRHKLSFSQFKEQNKRAIYILPFSKFFANTLLTNGMRKINILDEYISIPLKRFVFSFKTILIVVF